MAPHNSRHANLSPTKRLFDEITNPTTFPDSTRPHDGITETQHGPSPPTCPPPKRRSISYPRANTMLADCNWMMSGSFPSFMSVYGSEESTIYKQIDADGGTKIDHNMLPLNLPQRTGLQHPSSHSLHRRRSTQSLFTESTASSPTTTGSTFDSPVVSDNSASCSPESATQSVPSPSLFQLKSMPRELSSPPVLATGRAAPANDSASIVQDTTKNVKKLTLDMGVANDRRFSTADPASSAPISPAREPLKSARKKPANLSIRTPGYNQLTFLRSPGFVPPTPTSRPILHQYPSSPALSSWASPRAPPAGGMFLPLPKLSTHSKSNSSSSNGSVLLANANLPDLREEDATLLKSGETPERGYTEGPIRIYDSGVYLYLEPTVYEASEFDTVINVAKEVKNPFREQEAEKRTVMSIWRGQRWEDQPSIPEPQTAISDFSFRTASEWPAPDRKTAPITPTQQSYEQRLKEPEYLHVGWDHNSEILEDLYPLCQLIDDRTRDGKKVLIHCQLGVSRSASLIIAYGLFKGYQPDFHSMYMAVKDRSRWVGPNMSLIYQLTDFKSRINRGSYLEDAKELDPAWFANRDHAPPSTNSAPASAAADLVIASPRSVNVVTPQTSAKTSPQKRVTPLRLNKDLPPVPAFPTAEGERDTPEEIEEPSQKTPTVVKRAASRPLPFRERSMDAAPAAYEPRRLRDSAITHSAAHMDLAARDVPEVPSLFSPRATEFSATPWGIKSAGDLMTPSSGISRDRPTGLSWLPARGETHGHYRTASKDPRAPMQAQDARGIFHSIEDYL